MSEVLAWTFVVLFGVLYLNEWWYARFMRRMYKAADAGWARCIEALREAGAALSWHEEEHRRHLAWVEEQRARFAAIDAELARLKEQATP